MSFDLLTQNTLYTPYLDQDASGSGPSSRIWRQMHEPGTPDGAKAWMRFGDDFLGYNAATASGAFGAAPYYLFMDTATSHGGIASQTDAGGVIRLSTDDDADDAASFGPGQVAGMGAIAVGTPGVVTAKGGRVLFEARVRLPSVTDAVGSAFVGLSEVGKHADNGFFSDSHAVAQDDLLGFWVVDSNGDLMNFGYNVTSGTAVSVGTTALTVNTFVKLGFVYDPNRIASERLTWYVNGEKQGTYVTGATIGEKAGNAGSATFPAGVAMSPAAAVKTDSAASFAIDLDWWYCAMQRIS